MKHRHVSRRFRAGGSLLTAVSLAVLTTGAVLPAYAGEPGPSLDDPRSLIAEIAPDVLASTSHEDHILIERDQSDSEGGVQVRVEDHLGEDGDLVARGIDFTIDYATDFGAASDGINVLESDADSVRAYVQPTPSGVRVLTAIASADAPESYSYTFDVPEGSRLIDSATGGYYLEAGSDVLGSLSAPWALDSAGNKLPTHYTWDSGVLTQHVDLDDADVVYPVLLDPYWGYTMTFNLGKSPSAAWSSLQSCFNCEFPLAGAPTSFPSSNQLLPFYLGWPGFSLNFECRRGPVYTTAPNFYAMQFNATANHIDGYGSNIVFEIKYVSGQSKLVVSTYIVNDFWAGNGVYVSGAAISWAIFASNLST